MGHIRPSGVTTLSLYQISRTRITTSACGSENLKSAPEFLLSAVTESGVNGLQKCRACAHRA